MHYHIPFNRMEFYNDLLNYDNTICKAILGFNLSFEINENIRSFMVDVFFFSFGFRSVFYKALFDHP